MEAVHVQVGVASVAGVAAEGVPGTSGGVLSMNGLPPVLPPPETGKPQPVLLPESVILLPVMSITVALMLLLSFTSR